MDLILLIGFTLLLGQVGANLLRMLKIPQVVGFILMGVVLGKSVLGWLEPGTLEGVVGVALGLIGFTIGSQLRFSQLRKMGRIILWVALLEAFGAFFLVCFSVWALTGELYQGLIFGALASATAPAATVDVLQEYRCRGVFTTTLLAVVGIDDGLALIIYGLAIPFAKMLCCAGETTTLLRSVMMPVKELGGSILLGFVIGVIFSRGIRLLKLPGERLTVTLAVVLLASGLAVKWDLSLILTNMTIGLTLGNLAPREIRRLNEVVSGFTPPIYILFFAVVGASLDVRLLPAMGLLGAIYIVARAVGKTAGSALGAVISKAPASIRKYFGLALFSQAGVAIGLAIAISDDFRAMGSSGADFGALVISTITATTFVVQMLGPSLTRVAVFKAGEAREPGT